MASAPGRFGGLAVLAAALFFGHTGAVTAQGSDAPAVWATAGGGFGTRGPAVVAGGSVNIRRWLAGIRYSKSFSSASDPDPGIEKVEAYSDHLAVFVGRTLGPHRRFAIGVGRSKRWEESYLPGYGGWTTRGPSTIVADGPSLALLGEVRTDPLARILALGLEASIYLSRGASTALLAVAIDLGILR